MRFSLKVILGLWIGLFLIIGGLLFNAYSKLRPETLIALLTEQVQKNYPEAKLNVGKINYKFSLDFNLNLQDIHLRRSGKLLGSIGELELKVPWWLLLFNRGNAQINLSKLDIYIDHEKSHESEDENVFPPRNVIKVTAPQYLVDAKFTFRATDISIRDIHNSRRYFMLSKLLVREFQYGKNSAFELNIPIKIKHNETQYTSDLWLFGDLTPQTTNWKLNYRGEFRTKESSDKFQIEDLVINGSANFNPSSLATSSNLDLVFEKSVVGKGQLMATHESLSVLMSFTKLPVNYFSLVYEDLHNPYMKKMEGDSQGSIKFVKNLETMQSSVNGKLSFNGDFKLSETNSIPGNWKISFLDSRWEVSFISPKGEASFFRRSFMDMKQNTITQFNEEIGFTNLELNKVLPTIMSVPSFISSVPASYFSSIISIKRCFQDNKVFEGIFRYGFSPEQKYYQGELVDKNSFFKVNFSDKNQSNSLGIDFANFNISADFHLLAPFYSTSANVVMDGKIEGRWRTHWQEGPWLLQINSQLNGDQQGKFANFISNTGKVFELDFKEFKKQSLNLTLKNDRIALSSLLLENNETVKISGLLNSKQKSFLTLSYPKKIKSRLLKKEIADPYWIEKEGI
jgi:hypothetical protein